jgi:hypothetical protein
MTQTKHRIERESVNRYPQTGSHENNLVIGISPDDLITVRWKRSRDVEAIKLFDLWSFLVRTRIANEHARNR